MKRNTHPVDDFFKEALQEHQVIPSDAGRQRFLDEAATLEIIGKRRRSRWLLFLAGIVVVSAAGILLWWGNSVDSGQLAVGSEQLAVGSEQLAVGSEQLAVGSEQLAVGSWQSPEVNPASEQPPVSKSSESNTPSIMSSSAHSSTSPSSLPAGTTTTVSHMDSSSEVVIPNSASSPVVTSVVFKTGDGVMPAFADASAVESDGSDENNVVSGIVDVASPETENPEGFAPEIPKEDTVTSTEPISIPKKIKTRRSSSEWKFATSIYYSPEWMLNTLEDEKFVSNFGIEESFIFGRYSVRTGIGLSIANGTNELMVEYNDYLGSFDKLDSIKFNWDEKNYHLIPTYYLTNKDVWDSLLQLDYPKVVRRYTYLQIPLILGYDVLQTKRISVGFRAGPILSILIQSKQLSGEYDPGKNRIIQINNVTPDRVQTNWQLKGGINVSLHLSKRFGLELEPNIKYYFNSVYEKSDAAKKPWSVGFRAAFSILN